MSQSKPTMTWPQLRSSGLPAHDHGPALEQPFNSVQAMELYLPISYTYWAFTAFTLNIAFIPAILPSELKHTYRLACLWEQKCPCSPHTQSRTPNHTIQPRITQPLHEQTQTSKASVSSDLLIPVRTDSKHWSVQHLAHQSSTLWRCNTGLAITWFTNLWFLSSSFSII